MGTLSVTSLVSYGFGARSFPLLVPLPPSINFLRLLCGTIAVFMPAERPRELTDAKLNELCRSIVSSLSDRGTRQAESKTGRLISFFFENYMTDPTAACGWKDLWRRAWPEEFEANRRRPPLDPFAVKVRTAVYRARLSMSSFFETMGRQEPYRITIEDSAYRLAVTRNEPSSTPSHQSRPTRQRPALGLLSSEHAWFNNRLVSGAMKAADENGFQLLLRLTSGDFNDEQRQLESLKAQCLGIAMVPTLDEFAKDEADLTRPFQVIQEQGYHLVFVDHAVPNCPAPLVSSDNEAGGRLAAKLLSEAQCEAIYILTEPGSCAARERVEGATALLRELRGQDFGPFVEAAQMPGEEGGITFMDQVMKRRRNLGRKPLGVFATNDRLAEGVRAQLHFSRDRNLLEMTYVVGFGGEDLGISIPPRVSIREDFYRIGTEAVGVLARLLSVKKSKTLPAEELSKKIPVGIALGLPEQKTRFRRVNSPTLQAGRPGPPARAGGNFGNPFSR